jgi:hypothetical protein
MLKNIVLAGALIAAFASPAFAELAGDNSPNNPYNTNAAHLDSQSRGAQSWAQDRSVGKTESSVGLSNTNDGPNGTVIRGGEIVGQDPDPTVRATLGADYDQHGYN